MEGDSTAGWRERIQVDGGKEYKRWVKGGSTGGWTEKVQLGGGESTLNVAEAKIRIGKIRKRELGS